MYSWCRFPLGSTGFGGQGNCSNRAIARKPALMSLRAPLFPLNHANNGMRMYFSERLWRQSLLLWQHLIIAIGG